MAKLIGIQAFRDQQRKLAESHLPPKANSGVFRTVSAVPKAVEGEERTFRFIFSDGSIDRMGDSIDAKGWDTDDFQKNPVALWAHDSSAPPIGRASNVSIDGKKLIGDITFAGPDVYPFADTIYRLVAGKFLNAVSVGFMPIRYEFVEEDDRPWGIDFKEQELLEISVCPVPANPNALGAARAKGIDTRPLVEWAEKTLDGGGKLMISKAELERLRKAAKEPSRPRRRDGDGMDETDPSAGGALVATCGRAPEDECGMVDPEECAVHVNKAAEDKRIARLVARGVRKEIERLGLVSKRTPRGRRRSEDDNEGGDDPSTASDVADAVSKAIDHLDMAGQCFDKADDMHDDADDMHAQGLEHHEMAKAMLEGVDENPEAGEADDTTDKAVRRRLEAARKRIAAAAGA
jgi:HK97 family phage prohead protease